MGELCRKAGVCATYGAPCAESPAKQWLTPENQGFWRCTPRAPCVHPLYTGCAAEPWQTGRALGFVTKGLTAARAVEAARDRGVGFEPFRGDLFAAIGAIAVFARVEALEGGVDALTLDLAVTGLCMGHGLILERIHPREPPHGLLVEHDGLLALRPCGVFGVKLGQAIFEGLSGIHGRSVDVRAGLGQVAAGFKRRQASEVNLGPRSGIGSGGSFEVITGGALSALGYVWSRDSAGLRGGASNLETERFMVAMIAILVGRSDGVAKAPPRGAVRRWHGGLRP